MQRSLEVCPECKALVTDEEIVLNWGTCGACLDKHYDAYWNSPRRIAQAAVEAQGIGE